MSKAVSADSIVVATADHLSRDLDGEAVILQLKEGVYYGLNPVGTRIWELVREPRRVSELLETLLQEYEVEPEQCRRDLMSLLKQLAEFRLIDVTG